MVMDVRGMDFLFDAFDVVIDKSTIDSLMCSDDAFVNVGKMLKVELFGVNDDIYRKFRECL
jgi:hypothetical protein